MLYPEIELRPQQIYLCTITAHLTNIPTQLLNFDRYPDPVRTMSEQSSLNNASLTMRWERWLSSSFPREYFS